MLRILPALLLVAVTIAGCSGGGGGKARDPTADLDLEATKDTGVIRGVVVDQAIIPVAKVIILLRGPDGATSNTTSNEDGAFGFSKLAPGSYFLTASRLGYGAIQQSVDVVAGIDEPPVVKIQLTQDVSSQPTFELFEFQGYLECSVIAGPFFQPCDFPVIGAVGNDNSYTSYNITGNASFIHVSMVWEPTQAFGQNLYFNVLDDYSEYNLATYNGGASPLEGNANATEIADTNINEMGSFMFEVAADGEAGLAGASYHQQFSAYIVVFHGFEPPEGYAFWRDGAPILPG